MHIYIFLIKSQISHMIIKIMIINCILRIIEYSSYTFLNYINELKYSSEIQNQKFINWEIYRKKSNYHNNYNFHNLLGYVYK